MSLTVTCTSCRDPESPRRIIQWRVGSCRECCDSFVSKHLEEFPDHKVEISGTVSETAFGSAPERINRLFGRSA